MHWQLFQIELYKVENLKVYTCPNRNLKILALDIIDIMFVFLMGMRQNKSGLLLQVTIIYLRPKWYLSAVNNKL